MLEGSARATPLGRIVLASKCVWSGQPLQSCAGQKGGGLCRAPVSLVPMGYCGSRVPLLGHQEGLVKFSELLFCVDGVMPVCPPALCGAWMGWPALRVPLPPNTGGY